MSTHWDKDRALELNPKIRDLVDDIYRSLFPIREIHRIANSKCEPDTLDYILDRELHIDVILELDNEQIVTIQEKFRRKEYIGFNDFTLEFYSNQAENVKGEYFGLFSQFYSYVWLDESKPEILRHYIFKIPDFTLGFLEGRIKGELKQNKDHSKASFIAFSFQDFPQEWFVHQYPIIKLEDFM